MRLDTQTDLADKLVLYPLQRRHNDCRHARTENTEQASLQLQRGLLEASQIVMTERNQNKPMEWRIVEQLALLALRAEQTLVIVIDKERQHGMSGIERLDKDLTLRPLAPRTARHLLQHLKSPLVTAEIGLIEHTIGIEHRHQRHIVEMQALADHLRADQDVRLVAGKGVDDVLIGRLAARGIQIHTQHTSLREELRHLVLDTLRAKALHPHLATARRATGRYGNGIAAIVARQTIEPLMERERHIAIDATGRLAARCALQQRRIAAAIAKQDNLLVASQLLANAVDQRIGEMAVHLLAVVLALQIDEPNRRQLQACIALRERRQAVLARGGIVIRLDRGRCRAQQDFGTKALRQDNRHRTSVIARRRLGLLVRRLVLLVDHN